MDDGMPVDLAVERMFALSDDRETIRLQVPPLSVHGVAEPLRIHLDFDAATVDEILQHLTVLRSRMLPPPTRN